MDSIHTPVAGNAAYGEEEPEVEVPTPLCATYEEALTRLGVADLSIPKSIYIYPLDFESKDIISAEIEKYNNDMIDSGNEEREIKYTDMIGLLLSSVTKIVNVISYVLIAFVAISLVVLVVGETYKAIVRARERKANKILFCLATMKIPPLENDLTRVCFYKY